MFEAMIGRPVALRLSTSSDDLHTTRQNRLLSRPGRQLWEAQG